MVFSFQINEMAISDQLLPGPPSTAQTDKNLERLLALIHEDRRRTSDVLKVLTRVVLEHQPPHFGQRIRNM